jgi:hypothetical protein
MEERLEHDRYLPKSLIRFVRKYRQWLKNGNDDLLGVFIEFLQRLKDLKVIDDNVIVEVNEVVFQEHPVRPCSASAGGRTELNEKEVELALIPNKLSTRMNPPRHPQLPRTHCGICKQPIKDASPTNATHCKDMYCETARSKYHRDCVAKVHGGTARSKSEKANGPGTAVVDFTTWTCEPCTARNREQASKLKEKAKEHAQWRENLVRQTLGRI